MARLFQRSYKLVLGTHDVTGLHIRFRVEKSLKQEPNTLSLEVFNLNQETREELEKAKKTAIRLEAGYGEELALLYLGEVRAATSVTQGPDIITHLEAGDGEKQFQSARISIPMGPKTPADVALRAIAKTLGLGLGNVDQFAAKLKAKGTVLFPSGKVLSGSAASAMDDFTKSAGLSWSIQDGKIQIIDKSKPLEGLAFEVSSDHGLVESPSVDSKGVVNLKCLFIPGLRPGALLVVKSRSINGGYRVQKITFTGEISGKEWYAEIEATAVK